MRNIHCLEILERDPNTYATVVKVRFPFDELPDDQEFNDIEEFNAGIEMIANPHTRKATSTRLWFILHRHFPNHFFRFSRMNWKWDDEYYKNLVPGPKGSGSDG